MHLVRKLLQSVTRLELFMQELANGYFQSDPLAVALKAHLLATTIKRLLRTRIECFGGFGGRNNLLVGRGNDNENESGGNHCVS